MSESTKPHRDDAWRAERAGRRRFVREATAELDRFLQSQLAPEELVLARSSHCWITDRRILSATPRFYAPPRRVEFDCESLAFSQITRWSFGRQHDHRPLIRLEHNPVKRLEHVPAHRFLWFEWGNVEAAVDHTETSLGFGRDSEPTLVSLTEALERASVPNGLAFVVRPEGTREERLGPPVVFVRASAHDLALMRFRIRHPWLLGRRIRRRRRWG